MADIDAATQVVQQRQQDSQLVAGMLDAMSKAIMTPGSPDGTPGIEADQRTPTPPTATAPATPDQPTALQKLRGLKADGTPDEHLTGATSGATGDLAAYMRAASGEESGGNPSATNARTGASGTFQIIPSNWPSWAKEAGVDPGDHSAAAQEKVAGHKMQEYYDQFGSWGAVAVAWYAGPEAAKHWVQNPQSPMFNQRQGPTGAEPSINQYVSTILGQMKGAGGGN